MATAGANTLAADTAFNIIRKAYQIRLFLFR